MNNYVSTSRNCWVTFSIIGICIIVFLLEIINGGSTNNQVLINMGANYKPLVLQGQWWRLFTAMWLHIGIFHILSNMLTLYYIGIIMEPIYGHFAFALIYVLSGLAGNIASLVFNSNTFAAGASTAIFGIMGAFGILAFTHAHDAVLSYYGKQALTLIVINLIYTFSSTFTGGNIDLWGHLGGLAGGLILGLLFSFMI